MLKGACTMNGQQLPVPALCMCSQLGGWSFRHVYNRTSCLQVVVITCVCVAMYFDGSLITAEVHWVWEGTGMAWPDAHLSIQTNLQSV